MDITPRQVERLTSAYAEIGAVLNELGIIDDAVRPAAANPRGLGGFFVGAQPLMASQGARRVLTEHGRRFIERWRGDFGA